MRLLTTVPGRASSIATTRKGAPEDQIWAVGRMGANGVNGAVRVDEMVTSPHLPILSSQTVASDRSFFAATSAGVWQFPPDYDPELDALPPMWSVCDNPDQSTFHWGNLDVVALAPIRKLGPSGVGSDYEIWASAYKADHPNNGAIVAAWNGSSWGQQGRSIVNVRPRSLCEFTYEGKPNVLLGTDNGVFWLWGKTTTWESIRRDDAPVQKLLPTQDQLGAYILYEAEGLWTWSPETGEELDCITEVFSNCQFTDMAYVDGNLYLTDGVDIWYLQGDQLVELEVNIGIEGKIVGLGEFRGRLTFAFVAEAVSETGIFIIE